MRTYRAIKGPLTEAIYLKNEEIDAICIDELLNVDLLPRTPSPVRIDRFIEKRFGNVIRYSDLPPGVMGLTRFGKNGVDEIVIANAITDKRRVRTTFGHEGGHGLLHAYLFALEGQGQIFGDYSEPAKPKVLCREGSHDAGGGSYKGEWWEVQANRAIGSLLLPKPLLTQALEGFMTTSGTIGLKMLNYARVNEAVQHLSDTFDVHPIVAKIRINQMYQSISAEQLEL
jgi:hypothetical protein